MTTWPWAASSRWGRRGVDGVERAEPVDLAHLPSASASGWSRERAVVGDAGVGDDDVEAAGLRGEGSTASRTGVGVGHVGSQHVVASPGSPAASASSSPSSGPPAPGRAAGGERLGQRRADAARGARDQRACARRDLHRGAAYPAVGAGRYDGGHGREHATVAEEEYLQTLFWLQEAGLPMTGANVARAMQLSPPTVHEMIGRLERDGYITRARDKTISFTTTGPSTRRASSAATG